MLNNAKDRVLLITALHIGAWLQLKKRDATEFQLHLFSIPVYYIYKSASMSRKKLINKLRSKPKDFTFDELETLLDLLGFTKSNKGRTSGSR